MAYGRKLPHERGKQDGHHKSNGRRHMGSRVLTKIYHRGGGKRR